MKAGMAADPGQLRRAKSGMAGGLVASVFGWFAEISEAATYFFRLRHPVPTENAAERAVVEAEAEHEATDSIDAIPTTTQSCATALTPDVNVTPVEVSGLGPAVPDAREIERRRNLVRTLFNDFWSGAHNKPAAFVDRLDQAEDYLNHRLVAHGEFWRLDANTRIMLGLPPPANNDGHASGK